jgi:beta-glucosidase
VYFCPPQGQLGKPSKVLAGYKKTRVLEPGESELVSISFPVSQMASYDDEGKVCKSAYVLEKGEYGIFLGTSSRNLICVNVVTLAKDTVTQQLTERLAPVSLPKRLRADGTFEKLKTFKARDINATKLPANPEKNMGFKPQVRRVDALPMWGEAPKHQLIEVAEGKISLDEFIAQFTDEDLADLLGGQPNTGVANTFGFGNFPDFGVPNAMTADGPAGLRIQPEAMVHTTAFPCSTLLACSWDPEIVYEVGKAAGEEVKENNIAVWLTPAINIHRSPLCGRNFEYYSEDPLLAGKQAAAMVRGVQSNHIAVSVKHFALNNKETNRNESDSRASERAIREIYLKPFEIVVKESDPWTVMSSYNAINGVRASESHELLTDILRDEWGFKGMVTTDWWGHGEHYKEVAAGNDVKMANGFPKRLLEAKKKKLLTREEMETCGKRILELILKLD